MARRAYDLLRAQGFGVCCGLATAALLAAGSLIMSATRDGASAGLALDDIRPFFTRPSPVHLWFYLLVPTLGLYGLSALLATWHSLVSKWRAGTRRPSAFGSELIHLSFLVALLAHLVGGLYSDELGAVTLGREWRALPDGREARVVGLEVEQLPSGMPKRAEARVQLRAADGATQEEVVGYNQPLSSGLGSTLYLLTRYGQPVDGLVLGLVDGDCILRQGGEPCRADGGLIALMGLRESRPGALPVALLRVMTDGGEARDLQVSVGSVVPVQGEELVRVRDLSRQPMVLLRGRHAAGNPIALVSALVLILGVGLMWRRLWRRLA